MVKILSPIIIFMSGLIAAIILPKIVLPFINDFGEGSDKALLTFLFIAVMVVWLIIAPIAVAISKDVED